MRITEYSQQSPAIIEPDGLELSLHSILKDLEDQGWAEIENFCSEDSIYDLLALLKDKLEQDAFEEAAVGADWRHHTNTSIRQSHTCWIDNWQQSRPLSHIEQSLHYLKERFNEHFFLSLKRFESQLASYPVGGFYKKHVDQIKGKNHRQVSMILYLNDCDHGGELVLYDRDDKLKKSTIIKPKRGHCVLFFSAQIYHEVLTTKAPRFSLTTWFRDDL